MNISYLTVEKKLSVLDRVVVDFTKNLKFKNVICGKYTPLLFGKKGWTDTLSVLLEKLTFDRFAVFFNNLSKNHFYFQKDREDIFEDLDEGKTIKIYRGSFQIPYISLTFQHTDLEALALYTSIIVVLKDNKYKYNFNIRTPELEIPFLLHINGKNIQDAVYLYNLFSDRLDKNLFSRMCRKFKVNTDKLLIN